MAAYLELNLHNPSGHPQWFTVIDNVSGRTILDDNLDVDEVRGSQAASDATGHGDITYTPRGYVPTHRDQLNNNDVIDMN